MKNIHMFKSAFYTSLFLYGNKNTYVLISITPPIGKEIQNNLFGITLSWFSMHQNPPILTCPLFVNDFPWQTNKQVTLFFICNKKKIQDRVFRLQESKTSPIDSLTESFYYVIYGSSINTSKSLSNNLGNQNKHLLMFLLSSRKNMN